LAQPSLGAGLCPLTGGTHQNHALWAWFFIVNRRGGAKADGGIDLILERDGNRTAVQCKHWQKWNVGVKTVRELLGAMTAERIERGILVTLRGYTDAAAHFAKEHGVELLAEDGLISLLDSANLKTDQEFLRLINDRRKFCPKCESEMVLRTSKKGSNAGSQFWGCSTFPRCRFTLAVNTPGILEI
jgi:restriction system protein